ncbi:hypothetical protein DERP_002904 [Dermatophagoides pteronyssinus]|uniref:Uncharacterized protein n=1 Tax=Dermatophagoides pteronyssinus TaxID=6956 RepID=A0ABQ8JVZ2_DERPT|nr:hypothetical protein DERP_002904 [Dermatophagoides pteronyssinus]
MNRFDAGSCDPNLNNPDDVVVLNEGITGLLLEETPAPPKLNGLLGAPKLKPTDAGLSIDGCGSLVPLVDFVVVVEVDIFVVDVTAPPNVNEELVEVLGFDESNGLAPPKLNKPVAIGGLIFVDDVELIALKPKGVMVLLLLSSFNDSFSLLLAVVPDLDELSPNTNKFDEDDDTDAVGVVPVFGLTNDEDNDGDEPNDKNGTAVFEDANGDVIVGELLTLHDEGAPNLNPPLVDDDVVMSFDVLSCFSDLVSTVLTSLLVTPVDRPNLNVCV